jgi:alanine-glyoxylate transaminase/serine-glyoxylate transaminase/serine-pyruvate transaminase
VQSWYLDASMVEKYWGAERTYHHTAPISSNYALREALRLVCEDGLEARWQRHDLNHRALVAGLEAMGIRMLVAPSHRANCVNAVCVPDGVDDVLVRSRLLDRSNIDIAGGLGRLKGRIWRIGLMGSGSTRENVLLLIQALNEALAEQGYQSSNGFEAAEAIYEANSAVAV